MSRVKIVPHASVRADTGRQGYRQLDGEHRRRLRNLDPSLGGTIDISTGLSLREPEPTCQLTSGLSDPHAGGQQLSSGVTRGVLLATSPTTNH